MSIETTAVVAELKEVKQLLQQLVTLHGAATPRNAKKEVLRQQSQWPSSIVSQLDICASFLYRFFSPFFFPPRTVLISLLHSSVPHASLD